LSFEQEQVRRYAVRLIFMTDRPEWLRVYHYSAFGNAKLLKDLRPFRQDQKLTEYLDTAENVAAQCARI
jgi:hypothetical protein